MTVNRKKRNKEYMASFRKYLRMILRPVYDDQKYILQEGQEKICQRLKSKLKGKLGQYILLKVLIL